MNIKSLILGSAATFAAFTSAHAADAIVAATPEPMEYVKVCDAFGTGYFYIPGTETCLKFDGYARTQFSYDSTKRNATTGKRYLSWKSRTRFNVTAKNDSEYGTVYSWIRLQADWNEANAVTYSGNYKFGIGGLEFGKDDSPYSAFVGGGGLTDDGLNNGAGTQYVSYTGSFGAVSYMVGLDNDGTNNFAPNVVGGLKGTFGDYAAGAAIAYDESMKSVAARGFVSGKVDIFGFKLVGQYTNKVNNSYAYDYDSTTGTANKGFVFVAGASVAATDSISLAADFAYQVKPKLWSVVGDVAWKVTDGFSVLGEGRFDKGGKKSGFVRFTRSF